MWRNALVAWANSVPDLWLRYDVGSGIVRPICFPNCRATPITCLPILCSLCPFALALPFVRVQHRLNVYVPPFRSFGADTGGRTNLPVAVPVDIEVHRQTTIPSSPIHNAPLCSRRTRLS